MVRVHDVGQASFGRQHGFHGGPPCGFAPAEVGAAFRMASELDNGHDVDGAVDLSVPRPR